MKNKNSERSKVLVIDDEVQIADMVEDFLSAHGIATKKAYCGRKGLNMVKRNKDIGLIILDEKMPGMGGATFIKEVRNFNADISVVLLTGSINLSQMDSLDKGQYKKVLVKPVRLSDVLKLVKKILGPTARKKLKKTAKRSKK
jgi:DNA-binding NtrC family response regulator